VKPISSPFFPHFFFFLISRSIVFFSPLASVERGELLLLQDPSFLSFFFEFYFFSFPPFPFEGRDFSSSNFFRSDGPFLSPPEEKGFPQRPPLLSFHATESAASFLQVVLFFLVKIRPPFLPLPWIF